MGEEHGFSTAKLKRYPGPCAALANLVIKMTPQISAPHSDPTSPDRVDPVSKTAQLLKLAYDDSKDDDVDGADFCGFNNAVQLGAPKPPVG